MIFFSFEYKPVGERTLKEFETNSGFLIYEDFAQADPLSGKVNSWVICPIFQTSVYFMSSVMHVHLLHCPVMSSSLQHYAL